MSGIGRERASLGNPEVANIIMGQSPDSRTYNRAGIGLPFFQGKVDFGLRYPNPSTWCSSPLRIAEPGDILISVRAPVGDVNIATERSCIGRGITALRSGPKAYNEFLFYLLLNHKPDLDALGSGAIFKAINKQTLESFEIELPPLTEQRVIAAVLSKIQAAVEVQEKIVSTLKELKSATMAKLFREGLRRESAARRETRFGQVPQEWKIDALSEHAHVQTGVAKGRKIDNSSAIELHIFGLLTCRTDTLTSRRSKLFAFAKPNVSDILSKWMMFC
jgi:type I restriction enzyme, S subunit